MLCCGDGPAPIALLLQPPPCLSQPRLPPAITVELAYRQRLARLCADLKESKIREEMLANHTDSVMLIQLHAQCVAGAAGAVWP